MLRSTDGSGSTRSSAVVKSPPLSQTGPSCTLEFYYYLNDTGRSLLVYAMAGSARGRLFYTNTKTAGKWTRQLAWIGTRPAGKLLYSEGAVLGIMAIFVVRIVATSQHIR